MSNSPSSPIGQETCNSKHATLPNSHPFLPVPAASLTDTNPILHMWGTNLTQLSRSEFTEFTQQQIRACLPPCPDINGIDSGINPHHVEHFCYGGWQSSWDIHECIAGMAKLLNIDPVMTFLSQPALDSILGRGEAPVEWSSSRHFGADQEYPGPLHIPCTLGVWHNGSNHFVVVYICPTYWTILDPLHAPPPPPVAPPPTALDRS